MSIVKAETIVEATVQHAYRAFTNGNSLREWLCDVATVQAKVNGRIYLWWRGDCYSSGHFLRLEKNKNIVFRWQSNTDVAPSTVSVNFHEKDTKIYIQLSHDYENGTIPEISQTGWTEHLVNLKSVLETGIDLRLANRPLLGIIGGSYSQEKDGTLDIPIKEGVRIIEVVHGMGAKKSGLQKDDVIVEIAGQQITHDGDTLTDAIRQYKAGDKVEITYYRGHKKKTLKLELGRQTMPKVPFDPLELSRQSRELYESTLVKLEKCFDNYTDEQALKRPSPMEWSALEVVAHLIHNERNNSIYLSSLINGFEPFYDGFGENVLAQVEATVRANPSIKMMLFNLRRTVEELLAFTELIPPSFTENRGSYYRFGYGLLLPHFHLSTHIDQIKSALDSSVKKQIS